MKPSPIRIKTISEFHQVRGLNKPAHPLISIIDLSTIADFQITEDASWLLDFYCISLKRTPNAKYIYGQHSSDFNDGVLFFMSPNQLFHVSTEEVAEANHSGWILLIHPDFIWGTSLAKKIGQFDFFDYSVHEALFLSEKEENTLYTIVEAIRQETQANIDKFSQQIIISHIETLLNYSERFYERQFITRKKTNHEMLERLETLLKNYFDSDDLALKGLPSVAKIASELNVSPNYLSGLLKSISGQNTQQIIHEKLIEKAKEKLSTTALSISEIAYELGFEQPQSFSRIFKSKTTQSPQEFRANFNQSEIL